MSNILVAGYKYNFTNELVAKNYEHLARFPTNLKITHELAVAELQAKKIALFAGIDSRLFKAPSVSSPDVIPNNNNDANKGKCEFG
jgi:hypothetical protein